MYLLDSHGEPIHIYQPHFIQIENVFLCVFLAQHKCKRFDNFYIYYFFLFLNGKYRMFKLRFTFLKHYNF